MDILSDALNALQFNGSIYSRAEFTAPWGLKLEGKSGHAGFIFVVRGSCYVDINGDENQIVLTGGDFVMATRGAGYIFKSSQDSKVVSLKDLGSPAENDEKLLRYGGGGALTNLIMGCFSLENSLHNPLLESLPHSIHVRAEQLQTEPSLEMTLRLIVAEISGNKPGSLIAVRRLTDLLFIHALRFAISQSKDCPKTTGLLKALSDPQIGQALSLIHEKPHAPWTVSTLAASANMSRSSFAARFAKLTNKTPLEYVTTWRMNKAQQLLRDGSQNLAKIALDVGYQSEAAFSKAFRREIGLAPGTFRRNIEARGNVLEAAV